MWPECPYLCKLCKKGDFKGKNSYSPVHFLPRSLAPCSPAPFPPDAPLPCFLPPLALTCLLSLALLPRWSGSDCRWTNVWPECSYMWKLANSLLCFSPATCFTVERNMPAAILMWRVSAFICANCARRGTSKTSFYSLVHLFPCSLFPCWRRYDCRWTNVWPECLYLCKICQEGDFKGKKNSYSPIHLLPCSPTCLLSLALLTAPVLKGVRLKVDKCVARMSRPLQTVHRRRPRDFTDKSVCQLHLCVTQTI